MHLHELIHRALALSLVAVSCCSQARAEERPLHGGELRSAGPYRLELVTAHNEIAVYVSDLSGRELATAGGKGKAVVHSGGRSAGIVLQPIEPNILGGRGRYRLTRSSVVYVTIALPHARAHRAVFRPLSETPPRRSKH